MADLRLILAGITLLAFTAPAHAACIIDYNNKVICDDHANNSQALSPQAGEAQMNSRVQSVSRGKGLDTPPNMDAPINTGEKAKSKEDCREVAGSMISMCDGDEEKK